MNLESAHRARKMTARRSLFKEKPLRGSLKCVSRTRCTECGKLGTLKQYWPPNSIPISRLAVTCQECINKRN